MNRLAMLCAVAIAAAFSGCVSMHTQTHRSSSLVDFLYPSGSPPPAVDATPELRVPMRVGLAMLPSSHGGAALDPVQKQALLERVRERFSSRRFVSEIVVIPDHYLASTRGFAGLAGVQRLYDVDLVALVSYDQVTYRDDTSLALGYLTIVGAYVLPGTRHETATLVDLAVVDPQTRSLVLRAGGSDTRDGRATLVNLGREVRQEGEAGLTAAANEMIERFDAALTAFESEVRSGNANVRVVDRSGGGGALGLEALALLAVTVVGVRMGAGRRHRAGDRPSQPP